MALAINRASPRVEETKLKKNKTIVVLFDVNVQGPTDCSKIFDDASMELIGEQNSSKLLFFIDTKSSDEK